ncbi:MAG: DUF938 domain-containing protein [Candidatus Binatia bacterium]|nr:DUF938 domain-containing protein [Candidatus Binatia bacterium]
MPRRHAPATDRNREPILEVLRDCLPKSGRVLEIACGTGQHTAFFAPEFPNLEWQPSDLDPEARASTDEWARNLANVQPAIALDASAREWPLNGVSAIFCANMIHIAPIEACTGLVVGAGRALEPKGLLILYGPYRRDGAHTAASNASFDEDLRARNPSWGIRDLEFVTAEAANAGLVHQGTTQMPANNLLLVFRASADAEATR